MRKKRGSRRILLPALLSIGTLFAVSSQAAIITQLNSVTPVVGGYDWTYGVTLTGGEEINTGINSAFGTVYDFGPVIGPIRATGFLGRDFTFTTTSLFETPAFSTHPGDNTSTQDIRFTAPSGGYTTGGGPIMLGTFTAESRFGALILSAYDGQATSAVGKTIEGNLGTVGTPTAPEPASVFLFGSGISLMLLGARRKFSRVS